MNNDESYGVYCENCHINTANCDCPKGDCVECDDYRVEHCLHKNRRPVANGDSDFDMECIDCGEVA